MGTLSDKADQFEKAIQEAAFDGISDSRKYDVSAQLLAVAKDVWHVSERLAAIEEGKIPTPAADADRKPAADSASPAQKHENVRGPGYYA